MKEHGVTDEEEIEKNAAYTIGFLAKNKSDQTKIMNRVFGGAV